MVRRAAHLKVAGKGMCMGRGSLLSTPPQPGNTSLSRLHCLSTPPKYDSIARLGRSHHKPSLSPTSCREASLDSNPNTKGREVVRQAVLWRTAHTPQSHESSSAEDQALQRRLGQANVWLGGNRRLKGGSTGYRVNG